MSRKPIKLELKGLKTPRERVWDAMLKLHGEGRSFDKTELQDHCEPMVRWTVVDDYFDALEAAGYLVRVGGKSPVKGQMAAPIRFAIAEGMDKGDAPRLARGGAAVTQGAGTEAMWRAMKVLPVWDHQEIARAASLGDLVVKPETAKCYVLALARAGYFMQVRPSQGPKPARYRLAKNTGMHAPVITRKKVVFDRNTGTSADLQTAQEVCDGLE